MITSTADLDIIPEPGEILRRLDATARTQRILKRQLRLSLAAREEREAAVADAPKTDRVEEVAHVA